MPLLGPLFVHLETGPARVGKYTASLPERTTAVVCSQPRWRARGKHGTRAPMNYKSQNTHLNASRSVTPPPQSTSSSMQRAAARPLKLRSATSRLNLDPEGPRGSGQEPRYSTAGFNTHAHTRTHTRTRAPGILAPAPADYKSQRAAGGVAWSRVL